MNYKKSSIFSLIIIFIFSLILIFSVDSIDNNYNKAQVINIEKSIKKAAIQCYALEGSYPPNIEYMKENYGIIINDKKYIYHYEIFASNIMPIIHVIPKMEK